MGDDRLCQVVSEERIRAHIMALQGVRHRLAAPAALENAADYVASSLESFGYQVAEQRFTYDGRVHRNMIGSRPGKAAEAERIVILAHYDTVAESEGADDNASGVAVMLEVARVLAGFSFEQSVDFIAVTLEENQREGDHESGTCGSKELARHACESGWRIASVVVLESVAYAGEGVHQSAPPGVPVAVPETGDFIAVIGNERSQELVAGFCRGIAKLRLDLPHVPLVVPGNGELLPDSRRSDHAPFWDAGYRAIMVTDTTNFRNPHYHRPTDTLETLNLEFAAKVCRATAQLVMEVAGREGG